MYHSLLRVYLVSLPDEFASTLRAIPLPSTITLDVITGDVLDPACAAAAQVALVSAFSPADIEAARAALPHDAVLIACTSHDGLEALEPVFAQLDDIWVMPLANGELSFRLSRLVDAQRRRYDAWENEQFLESTINSIPCLVWYKTRDGVHEKVNDSFCVTVGKDKDDVQGRRHAYIWNVEADDPACIASENAVMETRSTHVSEETVLTGDGERVLTTYKSPLYDVDGSVMGTVGVAIDVTQENAYKNDLLQRNDALEALFTSLDCGIITHSRDGSHIFDVNQAALDILGYASREELVADGFDMVAPSVIEEDRQMLYDKLATLEELGDAISMEYRVRHRDGRILHVLGNVKLIENDGELLFRRFLLDFSAQKSREQERERRQQALLQALSEDYQVVCVFNLDTERGEIIRLSDRIAQELGDALSGKLTLEGFVATYAAERVIDEDLDMFKGALAAPELRRQLTDSRRHDILYRKRKPHGIEFHQATIVRAGDWSEESAVVIGLRNVDRQMREELEAKQLLEEALVRANRASAAKSTFLSNMSHDIRTPMNAIIGFTTLARNHMDDTDKVTEYLGKITASSEHLLSLINDVLDMSRIESGKISLEEQPTHLRAVLDDLASIMQPGVAAKGLTLSIDADGITDDFVACDKLKLDQILLNLLGNSVKFTEEGGKIELIVSQEGRSDDGRARYAFVVRDNGIGMTEEFLEHIFDPFERERTSTLSGVQGTGLGMAITKNLVDMMDGTIVVASEKGVGTEFTITLTFAVLDETGHAFGNDSSGAVGARNLGESLRGSRILLVDDNLLNREIGVTLLQDAGFCVDAATNGQEAIDMLRESAPDTYQLVLMDIQMPVMNGYETAQAIRGLDDESRSRVPILAVTADAFDEDRQKALDSGMNGHLAKPIEIDRLLELMSTLM